jgi:hypothetical protein
MDNRIGVNRFEGQAGNQGSRPYGTTPFPSGMRAEMRSTHHPWHIPTAPAGGVDALCRLLAQLGTERSNLTLGRGCTARRCIR